MAVNCSVLMLKNTNKNKNKTKFISIFEPTCELNCSRAH